MFGGGGSWRRGGRWRRGRTATARRVVRPSFDPRYVVKKYRRSAAREERTCARRRRRGRDLDMLEATTDYLLRRVFADQMPPPPHPHRDDIDERRQRGRSERDSNHLGGEEEEIGGVGRCGGDGRGDARMPFALSDTAGFGGGVVVVVVVAVLSSGGGSASARRNGGVRGDAALVRGVAREGTALLPSSSSAVGGGGRGCR
ncbi:hypothetical protein ACHAW5_005299 [Stephanodiscus triporus]|uniref:Uncharacterized protein n=1 Tax=Stephanodiscus triporus TaxID=2934178 RepID=A0ABD3PJN9_9STRA